MSSPQEKVIFMHIPKTGGQTTNLVFSRQCIGMHGAEIHTNIEAAVQALVALSQAERDRLEFISGHVRYGIHEIWTSPASYFTMLREPISRAVSNYEYSGAKSIAKGVESARGEFVPYLRSLERSTYYAARLAGYKPGQPGVKLTPEEAAAPHVVALAETNLKRMRVVALTEEFDKSMLLLRRAYGWRNVYYIRKNITANYKDSKKESVTPELRAELKQLYANEYGIYELARSLFQEQCRAYGDSLDADLALYRKNNAIYGRLYGATTGIRNSRFYAFIRRMTFGLTKS